MDILYHLLDSKWPFLASGVHHLDLQGATSSRSSMVSSAKTTPSSQTTCEVRFCSPEWLSQSWVGHTGALHVGYVFFFFLNTYIYIYILCIILYILSVLIMVGFIPGGYPWWLSHPQCHETSFSSWTQTWQTSDCTRTVLLAHGITSTSQFQLSL